MCQDCKGFQPGDIVRIVEIHDEIAARVHKLRIGSIGKVFNYNYVYRHFPDMQIDENEHPEMHNPPHLMIVWENMAETNIRFVQQYEEEGQDGIKRRVGKVKVIKIDKKGNPIKAEFAQD